jgi:putative hydrolase of the HAD superfamily
VARAYRGVLFDLFGTLVLFDEQRLPEMTVGTARVRTTIAALDGPLAAWAPGTTPAAFGAALRAVSEEIARARAQDHVETSSRERFRRALARIGCPPACLEEAARELSRAHLASLAAATVLPPAHATLLATLHGRHRLGVVSNFDDTSAAHQILGRHAVTPWLDTVVVSEALGVRKPHPELVLAGLRGLGLEAAEVLFVGDNLNEDGGAARAAGVDAAWIDAQGTGVPAGTPPPRYVLRALTEVAVVLGA